MLRKVNEFCFLTYLSLIVISCRFTAVAESLQQARQHLKKMQELEQKFTYDSDPIPQKKAYLESRALELLKNLLSKYEASNTRLTNWPVGSFQSQGSPVYLQLAGCREAALHAHPSTETPGVEDRRPVHRETPVRDKREHNNKRMVIQ